MRLRDPAEHRYPAKRRYRSACALRGERHTPTSQLDKFISTTAMTVEPWTKATRHLFKSFRLVLHQSAAATMVPSPCRPPDSISHRVVRRSERKKVQISAIRWTRKRAVLITASKGDCLVLRWTASTSSHPSSNSQSHWAVRPKIIPSENARSVPEQLAQ